MTSPSQDERKGAFDPLMAPSTVLAISFNLTRYIICETRVEIRRVEIGN